MFDATKQRYRDIVFEQINIDDPSAQELKERYGVRGIPCTVMLDASGNVLFNHSPPRDVDGFSRLIDQYR